MATDPPPVTNRFAWRLEVLMSHLWNGIQASLRDASLGTCALRGMNPTATFSPSLRDDVVDRSERVRNVQTPRGACWIEQPAMFTFGMSGFAQHATGEIV